MQDSETQCPKLMQLKTTDNIKNLRVMTGGFLPNASFLSIFN